MPEERNKDILPPMLVLGMMPIMFLLNGSSDNYLLLTIGAALSLLAEAVLIAVINLLVKKDTAAQSVFIPPLLAVTALFFAAAGIFAVCELVRVSGFLSQHRVGEWLLCTPVVLSGVYIASLSVGAQRRLCCAVLLITLSMYGITVLFALKNGSVTNLHLFSSTPLDDVFKGFCAGAVSAVSAVYYLLARLSGSCKRISALRLLAFKVPVLLLFTLPVIYVLGEHIRYSRLPAYDLAAFSKSVVIERFNGLYVLILTLAAVSFAAVSLNAVRLCLYHIISGRKAACEKAK